VNVLAYKRDRSLEPSLDVFQRVGIGSETLPVKLGSKSESSQYRQLERAPSVPLFSTP
jgi:hypothetical protein